MKNILHYIIFLIFIVSACETVVDIDIPYEDPELVLNGTLVPDSVFELHVSQSQHILDDREFKPVSGATVSVYEDDVLLTVLPDSANGYYISPSLAPQKGKTYRVVVNKDGFNEAVATAVIPLDTVKVLEIKTDTVALSDLGYTSNYLRLGTVIDDDGQTDNYYEITVYLQYYAYDYDFSFDPPVKIDSFLVKDFVSLESRDPSLEEYQSYGNQIIFDDRLFNGKAYTMSVLVNEYYFDWLEKPEFYVVLKNTTKSYYQYELTSKLQYWVSGDPFAQPVQVFNNVEGGYGILNAYNQVEYKVR